MPSTRKIFSNKLGKGSKKGERVVPARIILMQIISMPVTEAVSEYSISDNVYIYQYAIYLLFYICYLIKNVPGYILDIILVR